ncbi:site-specific integrase [Streptomyces sp. ODS28]|uniref:tyrosine-type recombinase/integrase n=1 Tax=Streptomyces sp. ODS28 TaxID=3136688 RepID=UPI0031EF918F
MATTLARGMGTFFKKCDCTKPTKCPHPYTIRYRDATGKQREEGGYRNQDASKDRLIELHDERKNTPADVAEQRQELGGMRFDKFAESWLGKQRHLADGSLRVILPALEGWIHPRLGSRRVNTFTPRVVDEFLLDLEREGASEATQNRSFKVLKRVLISAYEQGATHGDPMRGVVEPQYDPERPIIPTYEEKQHLRDNGDEDIRLVMDVMSGCGARTAEACAVNIHNIVADDVYRVTEQIHNKRVERAPLKHRKAGDFRETPLPAQTRNSILAYYERNGADEDGFLLRTLHGNYWSHDITRYRWLKARKASGVSADMRLYAMRHYFASNCLSRGIPITDVAEWMGHKSIEVTFKLYRHLMPGSITRAALVLNEGL